LSIAKSADRVSSDATQHSAKQREQSARSSPRASVVGSPTSAT
jgi:hypothetical protein